jgi:hypothetical protein
LEVSVMLVLPGLRAQTAFAAIGVDHGPVKGGARRGRPWTTKSRLLRAIFEIAKMVG